MEDGTGEQAVFLIGGGWLFQDAFIEQRQPPSIFVVFEDVFIFDVPWLTEDFDGDGDALFGVGEGVGGFEGWSFGKLNASVGGENVLGQRLSVAVDDQSSGRGQGDVKCAGVGLGAHRRLQR